MGGPLAAQDRAFDCAGTTNSTYVRLQLHGASSDCNPTSTAPRTWGRIKAQCR